MIPYGDISINFNNKQSLKNTNGNVNRVSPNVEKLGKIPRNSSKFCQYEEKRSFFVIHEADLAIAG